MELLKTTIWMWFQQDIKYYEDDFVQWNAVSFGVPGMIGKCVLLINICVALS